VLGPDAIAYSTVTPYLRQRRFLSTLVNPEEPLTTIIDQVVLHALGKQPFSSLREFAQLTCIPTTTTPRYLMQSLGFMGKHLHWFPHGLAATQKTERVALSSKLVRQLRSIKRYRWQFTTTLDESWFCFSIDREDVWLCPEEQPPETPRRTL
jgi:hypothetical protein